MNNFYYIVYKDQFVNFDIDHVKRTERSYLFEYFYEILSNEHLRHLKDKKLNIYIDRFEQTDWLKSKHNNIYFDYSLKPSEVILDLIISLKPNLRRATLFSDLKVAQTMSDFCPEKAKIVTLSYDLVNNST